jgi:ABC-2 type transport system permease protein
MTTARHTVLLTARQLQAFSRQPAYLMMNIVNPIIWLLLFGRLFASVAKLPGFAGGDYLAFLSPGIVMMMAMSAAAWARTSFIDDMHTGVMDRLLTSPTRQTALVAATMFHQAVLSALQTLIVLVVAWLSGVRVAGGAAGLAILLLSSILLTFVVAAFSNAVALTAREQSALIGISQMLMFPLMFLSSALMDTSLSPAWIRDVARFNPFEWAVAAGRAALTADPIGRRSGATSDCSPGSAW